MGLVPWQAEITPKPASRKGRSLIRETSSAPVIGKRPQPDRRAMKLTSEGHIAYTARQTAVGRQRLRLLFLLAFEAALNRRPKGPGFAGEET